MAYDPELADRIRDLVPGDATERTMFGGHAFMIGGHMAVAASNDGGLMLRCDPEETAAHLLDGATRFTMRGRELDGWLRVPADEVQDQTILGRWVAVGVDYASSLPAKPTD